MFRGCAELSSVREAVVPADPNAAAEAEVPLLDIPVLPDLQTGIMTCLTTLMAHSGSSRTARPGMQISAAEETGFKLGSANRGFGGKKKHRLRE